MAYAYPNFKTKRQLMDAVKAKRPITVAENTPWGPRSVTDGAVTLEGPHYPEPHKWYAQGVVQGGLLVKVR